MDAQQKRIKILSDAEVAELYALPQFSDEERAEHFSLSPQERLLLDTLGSTKSRATFILQSGYFKARHQFFTFDQEIIREDVAHIQERHFPEADLGAIDISKVTRLKQRQLILDLSNYRLCGRNEREALEIKAGHLAKISSKPAYLFRELLTYLAEWRVVVPRYTTVQDIISSALSAEQKRLIDILRAKLKEADIALLEQLLDDSQGLHEITQIKRLPKDLSVRDIQGEVRREAELRELYGLVQRVLPDLAISNESVTYYASLVGYYSVYKLKRLERLTVYVYLLCFIQYRYNRLHDNLIQSLLHHVKRFSDAAKEGAKERVYAYRMASNRDLPKAAQILQLFMDRDIPERTPFGEVKKRAFRLLPPEQLDLVATHIATKARFDETEFEWEHLEGLAATFKRYLRPTLSAADFDTASPHDPVVRMVNSLKTVFRKDKPLGQLSAKAFVTHHLGKKLRRYLFAPSELERPIPDRYEYLTYRLLRNGFEAGDIYCSRSFRFRSFENDLVSHVVWRDKDRLLADLGLPRLTQPIDAHLADLRRTLRAAADRGERAARHGSERTLSPPETGSSDALVTRLRSKR